MSDARISSDLSTLKALLNVSRAVLKLDCRNQRDQAPVQAQTDVEYATGAVASAFTGN